MERVRPKTFSMAPRINLPRQLMSTPMPSHKKWCQSSALLSRCSMTIRTFAWLSIPSALKYCSSLDHYPRKCSPSKCGQSTRKEERSVSIITPRKDMLEWSRSAIGDTIRCS
ncbi:hypothetical protein V6Z12_D07G140000 [Gossypium hirsutum]